MQLIVCIMVLLSCLSYICGSFESEDDKIILSSLLHDESPIQSTYSIAVLMSTKSDYRGERETKSFYNRVVKEIMAQNHSVHMFLCTDNANSGQVQAWYASTFKDVPVHMCSSKQPGQYSRLEFCYQRTRIVEQQSMRLTTRESNRLKFTHYLRARPELIWYAPLDTDLLHNSFVNLRAASLFNAIPSALPTASLADVAKSCLGLQLKGKHHQLFNNKTAQALQRELMIAHNVSVCAILDDQIALVPRAFAPSFFLQHDHEIIKTNVIEDEGEKLEVAQLFSEEYDFVRSSDMENTAGDLNSQVCCGLFRKYGHLQPDGALQESCGSRSYFSKMHNSTNYKYSIDRSPCIAEMCLTMRLYNRQVPFKISPFGCVLSKWESAVKRLGGAMCMTANYDTKRCSAVC